MLILAILAILLLLVAVILFRRAEQQQSSTGLPGGRIIYTDTQAWKPVPDPLYVAELGLTGKPDYLISSGDKLIPVEVKSSRIGGAPYDSHIFQLAAYCLLVEKIYKKRPPYGVLHYSNRTFAIDYTPDVETDLLDLLADMRIHERLTEVNRSHEHPIRCAKCGFAAVCDQKL